jgi:hypothetical protein
MSILVCIDAGDLMRLYQAVAPMVSSSDPMMQVTTQGVDVQQMQTRAALEQWMLAAVVLNEPIELRRATHMYATQLILTEDKVIQQAQNPMLAACGNGLIGLLVLDEWGVPGYTDIKCCLYHLEARQCLFGHDVAHSIPAPHWTQACSFPVWVCSHCTRLQQVRPIKGEVLLV